MKVVFATSPEAGSGKTTALVAIGQLLRRSGQKIGYVRLTGPGAADDAAFVTSSLRLPAPGVNKSPDAELVSRAASTGVDVLLVEANGGAPIDSGLFESLDRASLIQLVVASYRVDGLVDNVATVSDRSPDLKVLIILNAVPEKGRRQIQQRVIPALQAAGYVVVGAIPQDRILLGMAVGDLANLLGAEVLCAQDQLNQPVEAVMVAAMSDEGAEEYFRRISRKAVVAGGDRPDIHMPALATDTSCIVLTDGLNPDPTVLKTADEQGVPLLKVSPGTMPTLESISDALRQIRFRQPHKVPRAVSLISAQVDLTALYEALGIARQEVAS